MAATTDYGFGWVTNPDAALVAPHAEYFRRHRWIMEFALPPGVAGQEEGGTILRLHCSTASRPSRSFEEVEVHRINGRNYLAGKPQYEPLTINFYDNLPLAGGEQSGVDGSIFSTSQILEAWSEAIYQPTQGDAMAAVPNYKGVAKLYMLSPNALEPANGVADEANPFDATAENIAQKWSYVGIWPQQVNFGELDYANSEIQLVEATFRYDRAIMESALTRDGLVEESG